jgi:hypothetical protein
MSRKRVFNLRMKEKLRKECIGRQVNLLECRNKIKTRNIYSASTLIYYSFGVINWGLEKLHNQRERTDTGIRGI